MNHIRKVELALIFIIVCSLTIFVFIFPRINLTGHTSLDLQESFKKGNHIKGPISISLKSGQMLEKEDTILFLIIKNNSVLFSETMTMGEFTALSDNNQRCIEKGGVCFYGPGNYYGESSKIFNYSFDDVGNYESLVFILKLDYIGTRKISVS